MYSTLLPIVLIAIGLTVLAFGKRLSVLGAAAGALLGLGLLRLLPGPSDPLLEIIIVGLLALLGFFGAAFAKGIIDIVLLVVGALAGAAIVLGFFGLFSFSSPVLEVVLAVVGGVVGLILVRRFKEWAMIALAGLIGGLLITRGLAMWLPFLQGVWGSLLVIVLAGVGVAFQGGFLARRKAAAPASSQPAKRKPATPPSTK